MTHADVAFDVERRRPGEPERFHVGKHLGLEHLAFAPRSSETADQLVVDGTSGNTGDGLDSIIILVKILVYGCNVAETRRAIAVALEY